MLSFASSIFSSNSLEFGSCWGVPSPSDKVYTQTKKSHTVNTLLDILSPLPIILYVSYPLTMDDVLVFPGYAGGPLPRLFIQTVLLRRAALLLYLRYLSQERNVTVPNLSPVTSWTQCKEFLMRVHYIPVWTGIMLQVSLGITERESLMLVLIMVDFLWFLHTF